MLILCFINCLYYSDNAINIQNKFYIIFVFEKTNVLSFNCTKLKHFSLRFGFANAINDYERVNICVVCAGDLMLIKPVFDYKITF